MKFTFTILSLLTVLAFTAPPVHSQPLASVQFINLSPDHEHQKLDIYVNGVRILDNIPFRTATSRFNVPAGVQVEVKVADSSSNDASNAWYTQNIQLEAGKSYFAIATGFDDPAKFPSNPEAVSTDFEIDMVEFEQGPSPNEKTVEMNIYHCSPDGGRFSVLSRGIKTLSENHIFKQTKGPIENPAVRTVVDIAMSDDPLNTFAAFDVDLAPLAGESLFFFISGFTDLVNEDNPLHLQFHAILPDGTMRTFPKFTEEFAFVQVIHNSQDPALSEIDLYVNEVLVGDNIKVHEATDLISIPLDQIGRVSVAEKSSTSAAQAFFNREIPIHPGSISAIMLTGVRDPSKFEENPDGRSIELDLHFIDQLQLSSQNLDQVDLRFIHYTPDLAESDFIARNVGVVGDNLFYGFPTEIQSFGQSLLRIDVADPNDNSNVRAMFEGNLEPLKGRSGIVFTSGFITPSNDNGGLPMSMWAAFPDGEVVEFPRFIPPTSYVQFVHNSPDPALAKVDVYLGDELIIDDLQFRKATKYIDVPAEEDITISIAPSDSKSSADAVQTFDYNLIDEMNYTALLNGVLDDSGYKPDPDGKSILLSLEMFAGARTTGTEDNKVDVTLLHGSPDEGGVDVVIREGSSIFANVLYNETSGYLSIDPERYIVDVVTYNNSSDVHESFIMGFLNMGGDAMTIFSSGFREPADNQNGPELGLYGVFPDGRVFKFAKYVAPTAQLQIIHNSADPALESVDVYADDLLIHDNLPFREATEFLSVTAVKPFTLAFAPEGSTSPTEALFTQELDLDENVLYTVVLNGISDPASFADNPDALPTDLALIKIDSASISSGVSNQIEFLSANGMTDLGTVDFVLQETGIVGDDVPYMGRSEYSGVIAKEYLVDITEADGSSVLYTFVANMTPYSGRAGILFLSGFADPEANQDGAEVGLFLALTDGRVIEFPRENMLFSEVQVIHASADPAVERVDVYYNNILIADNLEYLTATEFVQVPFEEEGTLAIAPETSSSAVDAFYTVPQTLHAETKNLAVIGGLKSTSGFAPNPFNFDITLRIATKPDVRLVSLDPAQADFAFFQGVTDVEPFDFRIKEDNTAIFASLEFGQMRDYQSIDVAEYTFNMRRSSDQQTIYASFDGDITDLKGLATLVFSTGFLNPELNKNGNEFELYAAFPNGSVVPFDKLDIQNAIRIPEAIPTSALVTYPNPVTDQLHVKFALDTRSEVVMRLVDQLGREVVSKNLGQLVPGAYLELLEIPSIAKGTYHLIMQSSTQVVTKPILILTR
ncbi:MAG: hypothetical protein CL946_10265 [Ectothiorhodospiraceae bacterium]|nr:hypothetical protein [Ectothiorhodospiraceae bacterium]